MQARLRVILPDGTWTDIEGPDAPDWEAAKTETLKLLPEGAVPSAWFDTIFDMEEE